MARQPQLTLQVNSQQFTQFTAQFNQFSNQIKQLNGQFNQITQSMQRTNILIRTGQTLMQGLSTVTSSLGNQVTKITKQFISWSTIIGGITALLGMGGGLFGIERLAASILAKRRLVLGLGGDYGRTQASMIFSQGVIGSPQGVLQNIRMGMAGSPDQLTGLLSMGVNPFGAQAGMDPDAVMDKIVEKMPDILNRAGPGKELMMAKAYGLDKLFTDPLDMLRLATKEGQEEYKMKRQLVEEYKEQMKVTPRALRAWTELELQFRAAKATLVSTFGEKLADLAGPLKSLSESFVRLIRTLMDTPIVQQLLHKLADWIKSLSDKIKGLTEKDLNDFIKKIGEWLPTMDELKGTMHDFLEIMKTAVDVMKFLWDYKDIIGGAAAGGAVGGPVGAIIGGAAGAVHHYASKIPTPSALGPPAAKQGGAPLGNAPATAPNSFLPMGGVPTRNWSTLPVGSLPGGFGGLLSQSPLSTTPGMVGSGAATFDQRFGGFAPVPSGVPSLFGGAARGLVPTPKSNIHLPGDKQSALEPSTKMALNVDNWQHSRVTNLTVRNVPGSNIFLSAAAMTG